MTKKLFLLVVALMMTIGSVCYADGTENLTLAESIRVMYRTFLRLNPGNL